MVFTSNPRVLPPEAYTVALICVLEVEWVAARCMLDVEHPQFQPPKRDSNQYILGRLSGHNVVVASHPRSRMGTASSANICANLTRTFPAVSLCLMVGIGGGVPSGTKDVRLGDVAVSFPNGSHPGVVEYDLGVRTPAGFLREGILPPPPRKSLQYLNALRSDHQYRPSRIDQFVAQMLQRFPALSKTYQRPRGMDILFPPDYVHKPNTATCWSCDSSKAVRRPQRDFSHVHYGLIASGCLVMKDGIERDRLSANLGGAICFEMEAAGMKMMMKDFGCIVIRGISDYSDSHKNDIWQPYAAAAAAAFAKEMLQYVETQK